MNKKITSTALAALMIAGSTSFSAFAAMADGTVVIGTKAYDLAYANDPANATEITAAIVAGGTVYIKDFNGNWIDNVTGASINASVIPAVTYTDAKGTTQIGAGDATVTAATSVTTAAINAKSIKATFNGTIADTSKVVFTVKRGTAVVSTVTAGWNTAKTEATLTNVSNLPVGDYTVNVVNDGKDFGTSTITVAAQKIAKIEITSTRLGLSNISNSTKTQTGFATYKVFDQYGNDITTSSLANGLSYQCGIGSIEGKDGVIKITPSGNINILQLNSVVISAYDTSTGVNANATLSITSQVGTLNDINISGITNKDGKELTSQDTSSLFYLTYTATDMSGNPTTDYDMVKNGLILNDQDELTGTNAYITTKVVHDPSDSSKAAIQVQVKSATDALSVDMPIVLTAMTYSGKSSVLTVTLKREAKVNSIQLQTPSENIAVGEDKEIPFVAVDQNGKVLTKYADVVTSDVSVSGAFFARDADGNAVLRAGDQTGTTGRGTGYSTDGQRTITASVSSASGKYSTITINVQKKVMADTLSLDTSAYKTIMQEKQGTDAAIQRIDFGWDKGGLAVKDQYDRVIDMTTGTDSSNSISQYYVKAVSSSDSVVVSYQDKDKNTMSTDKIGTGNTRIALSAGTAGSATITFELYNTDPKKSDGTARTAADIASPVDTQSQTFTVLANKDIKDYTMDAVTQTIYADVDHVSKIATDRQIDYKANPKVYGTTASGAKVVLAGKPIISATLDSKDFVLAKGPLTQGGTCAYDDLKVVGLDFADSTKTGSSTKLTVNILGADKTIFVKTADIKSSTVDPVASSIYASVSTEVKGISKDNDTITLTESAGNTYADMLGNSLSQYTSDGKEATTQNIYIGANDQYGQDSMALSSFLVVADKTSLHAGSDFKVALDGAITGTAVSGDYITVTGTASNGSMKTIKIVFGASTVSNSTVTTAVAAINAGTPTLANYSDAGVTGVTSSNLAAINVAIAADRVNGLLTITQIKDDVAKIVGAPTVVTALATLNDSTTTATMRAAIEDAKLGLDLTVYNKLNSLNKNAVAAKLITKLGTLNSGFTSATAVQTEINGTQEMIDVAKTIIDTPEVVATKEFATNLDTIHNALLGGTIDNTNKTLTLTDSGAISGTGVFTNLKTANVTGIKFGDGTLIPIVNAAAAVGATPAVVDNYATVKAAVIKYFSDNGIKTGTKVDLTVKGTNGTSIVVSYSLVNAIK
ncbi:hypothetical protein LL037_24465 [Clostridium estertheticum]|uniref:hypothetical protein n=1 Tax=Clostridium estertheticum TaxID=238834 RepID=UPI001C0CF9A7|nr:hypothetical protein [Clostridium estertheticum]MBU3197747.1 hypothetical protein [Clostridium estertheticum]WAG65549.1 hypothetical protein LL037_24465 [Clostridium estertheticum]